MPTEPCFFRCPRRDSNPQTLGLSFLLTRCRAEPLNHLAYSGVSSKWSWVDSNYALLLVRKLPLPLGYRTGSNIKRIHRESHPNPRFAGPMSSCWTMSPNVRRHRAEAVGLEPTNGLHPPPVFKTGSSSSRMTSVIVQLRELESNQRLRVQSPASLPAATTPQWLCVK